MRTLFRLAAALAVVSLLILPVRALAHSSKAKMPMIGVRILSPSPGAVIHANSAQVRIAITHWQLSCAWSGKANKPGIGHYHILLDGALVNMFCSNQASVSLQNVTPGRHVLTVVPADNHHDVMMFMKEAKQIAFVYQPAHRLPLLKPARLGKPGITITSPKNGQIVRGTFNLAVTIKNFHQSCSLFGKHNLKGYGHWHVNVDSMMGPMMGMATMLVMSCARSVQVSTLHLKAGPHKFFAILVDNQHAPLMPEAFAQVTLKVR